VNNIGDIFGEKKWHKNDLQWNNIERKSKKMKAKNNRNIEGGQWARKRGSGGRKTGGHENISVGHQRTNHAGRRKNG